MHLQEAFSKIPTLAGLDTDRMTIQRIGGFTNDNYRLNAQGLDSILRLPRPDTNRWLDRKIELNNLGLAVDAGLAPGFSYFDEQGLMLSDHLANSECLSRDKILEENILSLLVEQVGHLHQLQPAFQGRVNLVDLINRYFSMMKVEDQSAAQQLYQEALGLLEELSRQDDDWLVSSHNDLVMQNLLLQDGRLWMIDWEYSSLASPYWDLATICNEAGLDDWQAAEMLDRYNYTNGVLKTGPLGLYRRLLAFLGDCWFRAIHP